MEHSKTHNNVVSCFISWLYSVLAYCVWGMMCIGRRVYRNIEKFLSPSPEVINNGWWEIQSWKEYKDTFTVIKRDVWYHHDQNKIIFCRLSFGKNDLGPWLNISTLNTVECHPHSFQSKFLTPNFVRTPDER